MHSTDSAAQILAALTLQNQLRAQIVSGLTQYQLGLSHTSPGNLKIYANRTNGDLWYTMQDEQPTVLDAVAVTGYLKELKFEEATRRGKQVYKLLTYLDGESVSHFCDE